MKKKKNVLHSVSILKRDLISTAVWILVALGTVFVVAWAIRYFS